MSRIPFNIQKAKHGAKVVTRDGRPVRILTYDFKGNQPIVGVITGVPKESLCQFSADGTYYIGAQIKSDYDLFLEVEPKYVPYTWETSKGLVGKTVKSKNGYFESLIVERSKEGVFINKAGWTYRNFLNDWTFLDGSPCGVLEE